jgi:ribosomal protein S18 acetylase RimI-like enzyme
MTHMTSLSAAPGSFDVRESDAAVVFAPEPFDSTILGLRIGRILSASAPSTDSYRQVFAELTGRATEDGYDQVLRRTALENLNEIWALERGGFELMDVGVTFGQRLTAPIDPPTYDDLAIRPSADEDIDRIVGLMVREPWGSRYESDPAYEAARVRELRSRWLWNSHRGRADVVLVGVLDGLPAGYVTCRLDREVEQGEIELVGTLPGFRGRGVASRVLTHAVAWFSRRAAFVTVRTQATNVAAARLYEGAGFTLHSSDVTFRLAVSRRGGATA